MIDVHSHILPAVDDGPANSAEAREMLALAAADGTRVLVATPHADFRYRFDPDLCRALLDDLRRDAPSGLRLCLGCEVHLTPENIDAVVGTPSAWSLNGRDCILLELPLNVLPPMVEPAVERLMDQGLRVIIAHPERNPYIQQQPAFAARLVEAGCFLQLTAGSLTDSFGVAAQTAATWLLARRLVHFVASDGHGVERRRPLLSAARAKVARLYGEHAADVLFRDNPDAALNGAAIRHMPVRAGWLSGLFGRSSNAIGKQQVTPQLP
jgi:protein-tyrosine phosphatase